MAEERDYGDEDDGEARSDARPRALAAVRDYERAMVDLREYLLSRYGDERAPTNVDTNSAR